MRYLVALTLILIPAMALAGGLSTQRITFETLDCDGSIGFAAADADMIEKILPRPCPEGSAVKEVYQVLESAPAGTGSAYRVNTTSKEGAAKVMDQVRAWQDVKSKNVKEGGAIIIEKTPR